MQTDLESPKFRLHEDRVAAVSKLLQGFFSTAPEGIGRSQQLALALATRSRLLHDYLERGTGAPGAGNTRRASFTDFSKFSATRFSMN